MDTQLTPIAAGSSPGERELVITLPCERETTAAATSGTNISAADLRRARIALGDYARTSGIYDPVDVLTFTRLCIEQATARGSAGSLREADVFIRDVLSVASASCGLRSSRRASTMATTPNTEAPLAEAPELETFVVNATEQKPAVSVPTLHERVMPPQPLGELPDMRPATLLNSMLQSVRRATWSLVSSLFVRSE